MKLKFNWGTGIVLFLMIYVGTIGWRVIVSHQYDINLVTDEYYQEGQKYEQQIERLKHSSALKEGVKVGQDAENISVTFPQTGKMGKITGEIWVYRPANFRDDKKFQITLNDSLTQLIPKAGLKKGAHELRITWQQDSLSFYHEVDLKIN